MNFWMVYLSCVAGVIISVVLPILRALLPKPLGLGLAPGGVWPVINPYVITGVFAAIAALVVVAGAGASSAAWGWKEALIAGYLFDSTLQKLMRV